MNLYKYLIMYDINLN